MKQLTLRSSNFRYIEQSFKEWLDILGYALRTVNGAPLHVREFFYYLEQKNVLQVTQIKPRHVSDFLKHLYTRGNLTRGGGLSTSSINSYITSLNQLATYFNKSGKHILDINPRRLQMYVEERIILTTDEIKQLYEASYEPHPTFNSVAMGQRDRAIIAMFYGCGLRKDEGSKLNINDFDLIKGLVFVKKGKGNKQRYVPIAAKCVEDIRSYLEEGRNWFLQDNRSAWHTKQGKKKQHTDDEAFFINCEGKRMQDFTQRLRYLKKLTSIDKTFSTHNLRHSIATHLLQSGMSIEEIAKFLGHGSLENTQIYTHIVKQIELQEHELTEL